MSRILRRGVWWAGIVLLGAASVACAETIVFKSGDKLYGRILERSASRIKVEFLGAVYTYSMGVIDSIDGVAMHPDEPGKKAMPETAVPAPVVPAEATPVQKPAQYRDPFSGLTANASLIGRILSGTYRTRLDMACYRQVFQLMEEALALLKKDFQNESFAYVQQARKRCDECFQLKRMNQDDRTLITPLYIKVMHAQLSLLALRKDRERFDAVFGEAVSFFPEYEPTWKAERAIWEQYWKE